MNYVMAAPRGRAAEYREMLKKIELSERDVLYVIGDVVDYGEDGIDLLTEMSMSANVYPVAGAHDYRALRMLTGFDKMLREGAMPTADFSAEMQAWAADGGAVTLAGFRTLDDEMREGVLDYLAEFALYEEVTAAGREYLLVSGGIAGFAPDKELDDYAPADFFTPAPAGAAYFEDRTVILGGAPAPAGRIAREGGVIRLDCGDKLACICLETGEEYYIE